MAYVPVPKDLSKIKTKLAFNLTKRQLVCFSGAAAVGLPAYLLSRDSIPLDVPFTTTFAPMIGSPRSSVMIPVTFRSCVTGTEALPAFPRLTAIVLFSRLK